MLPTRKLLLPFIATYLASFGVLALVLQAPGGNGRLALALCIGCASLVVLGLMLELSIRRPVARMHQQLADDRQQRESRLRLFGSAVAAADDAIGIIDDQGRLNYVNPSFEQLTGTSSATLMNDSNWWKLVSADYEMDSRAFGTEQWDGEALLKHPDGTIRTVEATTYLLADIDDDCPHYVLLMRDVTERNQQLEHIQELATAVENIEDCIIIADKQGAVRYANPAYEKRCGLRLKEMLGKQTNSFAHATSSKEVYADLRATVLAGKVWRGELQATFADGRRIIEEAIVSPVADARGQIINYVTTLHDVTERVRLAEDLRLATNNAQQANDKLEHRVTQRTEELRLAKEAAESASQAKSAFLATVSHEIRTPLNGVLGMLELLADHPLQPAQKRLLNSADTSATLLLALINEILDFSKIEAGQLQLDETVVSLRELTESVALSLAPAAHQQHIRLQSLLDPELPLSVKLDGVRLQQILLNLLGNAVKFTATSDEREGMVTLRVDQQMSDGLRFLRFAVTDNGIGIPAEALGTLFMPFTQAESTTTRRFGGTGLGLSISSRLVRLMGGEISVVSTLGEGSTFTVLLPLQGAAGDPIFALPPLPTQRSQTGTEPIWNATAPRGKILIAEDNTINQDVIRLQLKAIGFDSDIAADGLAALQLWRAQHYDLVLTDCHMPNMDGFALARAIRAEELPGNPVPIVALTANVLSEEVHKCRAAGMNECLTKPIQRKQLDKTLTVHLTARALRATVPAQPSGPAEQNNAARDGGAPPPLLNMSIFAGHIGCEVATQHELLRQLAADATATKSACTRAFNQRDADALGCIAHKLKSAARTVGAEALARLCVSIETAAKDANWALLASLLDELTVMLEQLRQEIASEISLHQQTPPQIRQPTLAEYDA